MMHLRLIRSVSTGQMLGKFLIQHPNAKLMAVVNSSTLITVILLVFSAFPVPLKEASPIFPLRNSYGTRFSGSGQTLPRRSQSQFGTSTARARRPSAKMNTLEPPSSTSRKEIILASLPNGTHISSNHCLVSQISARSRPCLQSSSKPSRCWRIPA